MEENIVCDEIILGFWYNKIVTTEVTSDEIALEAHTVPSESLDADIRETISCLYHKEVTKIQREIHEKILKLHDHRAEWIQSYLDNGHLLERSQDKVEAMIDKAEIELREELRWTINQLKTLRSYRRESYREWKQLHDHPIEEIE